MIFDNLFLSEQSKAGGLGLVVTCDSGHSIIGKSHTMSLNKKHEILHFSNEVSRKSIKIQVSIIKIEQQQSSKCVKSLVWYIKKEHGLFHARSKWI